MKASGRHSSNKFGSALALHSTCTVIKKQMSNQLNIGGKIMKKMLMMAMMIVMIISANDLERWWLDV